MNTLFRRWLDLRIGPRVLVWLLVTALATLAVAVVSIYYLQSLGQRLTIIAERDRTTQTAALQLETVVEKESAGVLGYLLSGDPSHLAVFTSSQVQFSAIAQGLESLSQAEEDPHLLSEINSLHSEFRLVAEEQVNLRDHGFPLAATFLWQTQGHESKSALDRKLAEYITRQESVITEHSEKAAGQRRQALAISLGLVGLTWVVAVVGGMITTRSIVGPIRKLVSATEAIGGGDTATRIEIAGKDELALLGNAMDQMAQDLDESKRRMEQLIRDERHQANQLRAITDVGRKISSILTLEELLPYVAGSVRDTFGYYSVNIFLLDTATNALVLKACATHSGVQVSPGRSLKLGSQGIVCWVADNGKSLFAPDVSKEPRFLFAEELPETRAEAAAPIKLGDEILGVLDIQSSDLHGIRETDVPLVETLADQVAIAIENARLYEQTRELAIIEERNRMAREIHDTLAQGFTGIVLQLEAAEQAMEDGSTHVAEHLNQARTLARESLQAARRSVWNLLPRALEQHSLEAALREEVRSFSELQREEASFVVSGDRRELRPDVQSALLRICQESLTNVRRHAKATRVEVALAFGRGLVCLSVRDNGVGFDSDVRGSRREGGFGLYAMEQRARLVGGTLAVKSRKGEGTTIEVNAPAA